MKSKNLEVLLCMVFAWGLWLLLPAATFATLHSYDVLSTIMSEAAWGAYAIVSSVGGMLALRRRETRWFKVAAGMISILWLGVAFGFVLSAPFSTAVPTYVGLSLLWLMLARRPTL